MGFGFGLARGRLEPRLVAVAREECEARGVDAAEQQHERAAEGARRDGLVREGVVVEERAREQQVEQEVEQPDERERDLVRVRVRVRVRFRARARGRARA